MDELLQNKVVEKPGLHALWKVIESLVDVMRDLFGSAYNFISETLFGHGVSGCQENTIRGYNSLRLQKRWLRAQKGYTEWSSIRMVVDHNAWLKWSCTIHVYNTTLVLESMTKNNSPIFLPPFPHGRAEAIRFLRVMSENIGIISK